MARIPIVDENDPVLAEAARLALENAGLARGRVLNVHRALANRPEALNAFTDFIQTVYRGNSTLDRKHGELAYITATAVNNCFY
jgi:alkylhydroperoxidase family enzyme